MLHEVLLALSGHPSPLFGGRDDDDSSSIVHSPLLSPSEQALLQSLSKLSHLHRKLRTLLVSISSSHQSVTCRAVATSINLTHLARFQQKILHVESKILKRDASMVGAYEIVPLATVVTEFDDWHRRMAWYWDITTFMTSPKADGRSSRDGSAPCSSARLIDRLRIEIQTGYRDIEDSAIELTCIAESAWLRQLCSWLVYGKLPSFGTHDFFVRLESGDEQNFIKEKSLVPAFVPPETANSIMFVGKCLHQIQQHRQTGALPPATLDNANQDVTLSSGHLEKVSALPLPIVASMFSRTISEIRLSLSQNILQHLLPMTVTMQVLSCLRQYFLMHRGEFATALIVESEKRIISRQQTMGRSLQQDPVKALRGLTIKEAEFDQTIQQVWKSLALEDKDEVDNVLDFARQNVSLSSPKPPDARPSTSDSTSAAAPIVSPIAFNDLLFPNSSELTLNLSSPIDLFLSHRDIATYSSISSYLLAIRRGHQRLSELWRRSAARRDHPLSSGQDKGMRRRRQGRAAATRKIWATCSATIFLLSESSAFFEGEIITGSYNHFRSWVQNPVPRQDLNLLLGVAENLPPDEKAAQRDPETLAVGHRTFLASLVYAILLTDIPYTNELRSLLRNVDNLIAFFNRLLDIQQKLDLEHQAGGESAHTSEDAQRIALELDRTRKRVDSDLKCVVNRLRQLDHERIGSLRYLDVGPNQQGEFDVWKGGGVDRLLMKLDFGRVPDDGDEVV